MRVRSVTQRTYDGAERVDGRRRWCKYGGLHSLWVALWADGCCPTSSAWGSTARLDLQWAAARLHNVQRKYFDSSEGASRYVSQSPAPAVDAVVLLSRISDSLSQSPSYLEFACFQIIDAHDQDFNSQQCAWEGCMKVFCAQHQLWIVLHCVWRGDSVKPDAKRIHKLSKDPCSKKCLDLKNIPTLEQRVA